YEVTAFDPPKRTDFKAIAGPIRPTGSYVLSTTSDGRTKLTFSLDAKLGFFKRLVMGRMVQKTMDGEMLALDKLKKVLEAQHAAGSPAANSTAPGSTSAAATAKAPSRAAPKPTSRRAPKK